MSVPAATNPSPTARSRLARAIPLVVIVLASVAAIAISWHLGLSPVALLERRAAIDAFVDAHRYEALAAFTVLYAVAVALSLPGASLLTICGGVVFGGFAAGTAALVGATAGATIIFLIARSAIGDWLIRRAGRRAEDLAAGFCADAFHYLLFLRLVPLFPFWLVNLVPALCGVRLTTFVVTTALGIIPGTYAFAYFGAGLDRAITLQMAAYHACVAAGRTDCKLEFDPSAAATPQLITALIALGVLALIPVVIKRWRTARAPVEKSDPR